MVIYSLRIQFNGYRRAKKDQQVIYDYIRNLNWKANKAIETLAENIDNLYEKMEKKLKQNL